MALLPFLIKSELRPRRHNRLFDLDLCGNDILSDIFDRPIRLRDCIQPLSRLSARDVRSTIKSDKDKFQVNLDVQHFSPEEISVKTADGYLIVEGKHEEKEDDHGFVSRQFKRRYTLPEECNPDTVESRLSSDGVLTVTAPKSTGLKGERSVTIIQTGPVRRKISEEEEETKEVEVEEKSAQKKRRR